MQTLLGIDIGGTKLEGVLLREGPQDTLHILHRQRIQTLREQGYAALLERTAAFTLEMLGHAGQDPASIPIGIGMPGGLTRSGLIKNSNTTCLNGRPFRSELEQRLGRSITFENDANCFALAETLLGAAKPHAGGVVFGVILGTGVGGGLVFSGRLWPGRQGIAGEWGHHTIFPDSPETCYCGRRGCLELFASGPATERHYARLSGQSLPLAQIAAQAHNKNKNPAAQQAIACLLEAFARGLGNLINILDPSAVVIGGGVSNLDALYTEGPALIAQHVFNDELRTPILKNSLGDSSGVLGAALLNASSSPYRIQWPASNSETPP